MKWLTRTAAVLLALAAVLALVPFFVSLQDSVPLLEKELSGRLKQPVSIERVHASFFPLPHATLDGIVIGDAEDVTVRKVTLKPDFWSLFGSSKVIRSIEFEDLVLSQKALGLLVALTQGDRGSSGLRLETVRLRNAVVKLEQGRFGPFEADVRVSRSGQPGELTLATEDGAFKARVGPHEESFALEFKATNWTPPLGPRIRFEALEVKGLATTAGAELNEIKGKLYGGMLNGTAAIGWDKGVTVKGEVDLKQVELKDAMALVSPKTRVSGRLDAKPVFAASAPKASGLDEALRLETRFNVHEGVLHGFDLASAAAAVLLKQGRTGGQTRFDELSGRLVMERESYRFSQLRVAADGLTARGELTVTPSRALSGQLTTSIKGARAGSGIPLLLAGTVDAPVLYPNPTALLGAAAGTAVLGPGAATAAGALEELAKDLLGKRRR
jgi:uncharacterized protein involved in outer membrane biogenesis